MQIVNYLCDALERLPIRDAEEITLAVLNDDDIDEDHWILVYQALKTHPDCSFVEFLFRPCLAISEKVEELDSLSSMILDDTNDALIEWASSTWPDIDGIQVLALEVALKDNTDKYLTIPALFKFKLVDSDAVEKVYVGGRFEWDDSGFSVAAIITGEDPSDN
ncbi:MAG: hypothetical protein QG574_2766 [Cyanobacteriota bacterium erpe_2018_sw_21hr_WHONDRS-SW48-000092_B_bin.40]|jgi:hypothetical protein|nr:hypothetical protein [Cyanobacteriota bacterium erpe_2018_sw_21hr_WHONDRS-SW48-000092_B_bin.40]